MKRKNGFTLIELVVVIALIAILAVTLAPRLRDQIAKGRDSKAIALLGSIRTASEIYFADNGQTLSSLDTSVSSTAPELTTTIMDVLEDQLDNSARALLNDSATTDNTFAPIGGGRGTATGGVTYGGEVSFTFGPPSYLSGVSYDGIAIWLDDTSAVNADNDAIPFDTKGISWASY